MFLAIEHVFLCPHVIRKNVYMYTLSEHRWLLNLKLFKIGSCKAVVTYIYFFVGTMSSRDLSDSDVLSMSKKVTTLEMKELNERQRADHAVSKYVYEEV